MQIKCLSTRNFIFRLPQYKYFIFYEVWWGRSQLSQVYTNRRKKSKDNWQYYIQFITIKEFCNVTISNHDVCNIQYFDLSFFLYLMNLVSHVFGLWEEDHSCHKYVLIGEKSPKTTDIIFDLFCHHHGILQRCNLLTMMPACNTVVWSIFFLMKIYYLFGL